MDLSKLSAQLGKYEGMKQQLPPVHDWHPDLSGDIDIIIKSDGRWFHEGDEIKREKLVRIFSTILKKEGEEYFLVTPVEKWRIQVEDAPFQIVLSQFESGVLSMISNAGDEVSLDGEAGFQFCEDGLPQIEVRSGLMAKLNRNVYYQLAEHAIEKQEGFFIRSAGVEYLLSKA